jgi:hypothetical protein
MEQEMQLNLNVVLLSVCGLAAVVPVQAQASDGWFVAARETAQQDRRDARQARKAKKAEQQNQQDEQVRNAEEHESERGYGYGYERRTYERVDERGRR